MTEVKLSQPQRLVLDFGPLLGFFAASWWDIFVATEVLIGLTLIALAIRYWIKRSLTKFEIFGSILLVALGILAVAYREQRFLVAKVTVLEFVVAAVLVGGMRFGRLFIKDMMGQDLQMPDEAWRIMTYRWAGFSIFLGILNLAVYYYDVTYLTQHWVTFKVFGTIGLTFAFAMANAPFMAKYIKD